MGAFRRNDASPLTRAGRVLVAMATVAVLTAVASVGAPARAQIPTLPGGSSTTVPPPPTTTTTEPLRDPPPTTTTTAAPEPAPAPPSAPGEPEAVPGQPAGPGDAAAGAASAAGPTGAPTTAPSGSKDAPAPPADAAASAASTGEVPAEAQSLIRSVRRSPANSTRKLLAALAPLQQLGMSEAEAIAAGFGRFPVGGYATFSHDWLFPRFTPSFHLHEGTDLFAVTGTPVRSPADGILKLAQGGSGGLAAYVYQPDGTYYYMAHLDRFVPGQRPGQQVKVGEVVGYVGDSGNAKGGSPHLHFEIHPAPTRAVVSGKGKTRTVTHVSRPVPVGTVLPPMDPKATLDQWLREALEAVPQLIAAVESRPRALAATGTTRRLPDGRAGAFPAPVAPPRSQLLWASSVNPSGGALRLAEAEALLAAREYDWVVAARRQQAQLPEQVHAQARTAFLLAPLTPPALRPASTDS